MGLQALIFLYFIHPC